MRLRSQLSVGGIWPLWFLPAISSKNKIWSPFQLKGRRENGHQSSKKDQSVAISVAPVLPWWINFERIGWISPSVGWTIGRNPPLYNLKIGKRSLAVIQFLGNLLIIASLVLFLLQSRLNRSLVHGTLAMAVEDNLAASKTQYFNPTDNGGKSCFRQCQRHLRYWVFQRPF